MSGQFNIGRPQRDDEGAAPGPEAEFDLLGVQADQEALDHIDTRRDNATGADAGPSGAVLPTQAGRGSS